MQHMTDAANEIASIAQKIVDRKGAHPITRPSIGPAHVHISGIPETPYEHLVGREAELKKLDNAWASRTTNVISLIAEGGAGKTALLNEWLKRLQAEARVCVWYLLISLDLSFLGRHLVGRTHLK